MVELPDHRRSILFFKQVITQNEHQIFRRFADLLPAPFHVGASKWIQRSGPGEREHLAITSLYPCCAAEYFWSSLEGDTQGIVLSNWRL